MSTTVLQDMIREASVSRRAAFGAEAEKSKSALPTILTAAGVGLCMWGAASEFRKMKAEQAAGIERGRAAHAQMVADWKARNPR